MKKVKVRYESSKGITFYPEFIDYPNTNIDLENHTIDGAPYIEISEQEWIANLGKELRIINGVLQEYIPSLDERRSALKYKLISVRKAFLSNTDWYVSREVDQPNSYRIDVKNKRILARKEINDIELCTTLAQLQQFSETFE